MLHGKVINVNYTIRVSVFFPLFNEIQIGFISIFYAFNHFRYANEIEIIFKIDLIFAISINNSEKPLSSRMSDAMRDDPIAPVLWQPHLAALDRRLVIVLQAIRDCIKRNGADNVIIAGNNANST